MNPVVALGEGGAQQLDADALGLVGFALDRLAALALPVAPGFTITAAAQGEPELRVALLEALTALERAAGLRMDDPDAPLLLVVHTSAGALLPGRAAPVRNVGLSRSLLPALSTRLGDEAAVTASYVELVRTLSRALGVRPAALDDVAFHEFEPDERINALLGTVEREAKKPFPDDLSSQLLLAVELARATWLSPRAVNARRAAGADAGVGLAIHVQALRYGAPSTFGTATVTSRDPGTGERVPSGTVRIGPSALTANGPTDSMTSLRERWPAVADKIESSLRTLERYFGDMAEAEFEIGDGRISIVQAGVAKDRHSLAGLRTAMELVDEGVINEQEAVVRVEAADIERLLHPRLALSAVEAVLAHGLGVSPGAASGRLALTSERAEATADSGAPVILLKSETVPEDLPAMIASKGIVTTRGGSASHAAVVARGMGKPAVCGAPLTIDHERGAVSAGDVVVHEGELVAIDGATGLIAIGDVPVVAPSSTPALHRLLAVGDRYRRLRVRANADTPQDAQVARDFGAEGIGLCRTEHQFLGARLPLVQRMILASDEGEEQAALEALAAVQRDDFVRLLEVMDGLPVTVRLLDAPLHEFLPDHEELAVARARGELDDLGLRLLELSRVWRETNPMLGTRGVRLALLKPGLYPAQARALFEAAAERISAGGDPIVEVMIPLVVARSELAVIATAVREEADAVAAETGVDLQYSIGTMIETPRAALVAGELATEAEFVSFGTNDLTQLTFGFSRDDVESRLLPHYLQQKLLTENPFQTIDKDGVGALLALGVANGRSARPDLKVGLCGEHGGDPASVRLCHRLGFDYVSCSPYRLPIARLAAAQAALEDPGAQ